MEESTAHDPHSEPQNPNTEDYSPTPVKSKRGGAFNLPDNSHGSSVSSNLVTGSSHLDSRPTSSRMKSRSMAQSNDLSTKATPQVANTPDINSQNTLNDVNTPPVPAGFNVSQIQHDRAKGGGARGNVVTDTDHGRQILELREQLDAVTKERDSLLDSRGRVTAQLEGRIRRLERQLEQRGETPAEVGVMAIP